MTKFKSNMHRRGSMAKDIGIILLVIAGYLGLILGITAFFYQFID